MNVWEITFEVETFDEEGTEQNAIDEIKRFMTEDFDIVEVRKTSWKLNGQKQKENIFWLKMKIKTKPPIYIPWEFAKPGKYHYNPQKTIDDYTWILI